MKFYYQYSFTNCFHNIKNTLFSVHIKEIDSFLERKSIASNLNSNLDSTELSPIGGNTSGRKEGIFSKQCASFSIILNQQQFSTFWQYFLAILAWSESLRFIFGASWHHLLSLLGLDNGSFQDSFPSVGIIWAPGLSDSHTSLCPHCPTIDSPILAWG